MFQSTTQLIITLLFASPFALALIFTLIVHFRKTGEPRSSYTKASATPQQRLSPDQQSTKLLELQANLTSALSKAVELDRPALALLITDALEEAKRNNDSLKGP